MAGEQLGAAGEHRVAVGHGREMFPLFSLGSQPALTSATPVGIVRNLS